MIEFVHYIDATEESKKLSPYLYYEKETREFYEYLRNERAKLLNVDKLKGVLKNVSEMMHSFSILNGNANILHHQKRKYNSFHRRIQNITSAQTWIKNRQAIRDFDRKVIPFAFAFARERQREATMQARMMKKLNQHHQQEHQKDEPKNANIALPEFVSSAPFPLVELMKNNTSFQNWLEVIRGAGEQRGFDEPQGFDEISENIENTGTFNDVEMDSSSSSKRIEPKEGLEPRTLMKRCAGRKRNRDEEITNTAITGGSGTGNFGGSTTSGASTRMGTNIETSINTTLSSAATTTTSDVSSSRQVWHELQIELPSLGTNQHCIYVNSNDICDICNETMEMATELPVMVCPKCNSTRTCYQGNKTMQNSQCSKYVRKVHFRLYLTRFQWRETMVVPIDAIWHVSNFLAQCGFTSKTTTVADVRWALQELRLSKYYNNITQVYCRVCNQSPPCLSPDEITKFFQMFDEIQDVYYQLHHQSRTNFLSYQYVMYKLCELQGLNIYLPYFKMLKGDTNLLAHDEIWKEICEALDWTFVETLPTTYTVQENVKTYLNNI